MTSKGNPNYSILSPLADAINDGTALELSPRKRATIKTALTRGDICIGPSGLWIVLGGAPDPVKSPSHPHYIIPGHLVGKKIG